MQGVQVELWSAPKAAAGARGLRSLDPVSACKITTSTDGTATGTVEVPFRVGYDVLPFQIVRVIDGVGRVWEMPVTRVVVTDGKPTVTLECGSLFDLIAGAGLVRTVTPDLLEYDFSGVLTPYGWVSAVVLANATEDRLDWLRASPTLDNETLYELTVNAANRVELLRGLEEATRSELRLTRVGDAYYEIALADPVAGVGADLPVLAGKNQIDLTEERDSLLVATEAVPIMTGETSGDPLSLSDCLLHVTAISGTDITVAIPGVEVAPVSESGQLDGTYLKRPDGTYEEVVSSQLVNGACVLAVDTLGTLAVGDRVQFYADGVGTPLIGLRSASAREQLGGVRMSRSLAIGTVSEITNPATNTNFRLGTAGFTVTPPSSGITPSLSDRSKVTDVPCVIRDAATGGATSVVLSGLTPGEEIYAMERVDVTGGDITTTAAAAVPSTGIVTVPISAAAGTLVINTEMEPDIGASKALYRSKLNAQVTAGAVSATLKEVPNRNRAVATGKVLRVTSGGRAVFDPGAHNGTEVRNIFAGRPQLPPRFEPAIVISRVTGDCTLDILALPALSGQLIAGSVLSSGARVYLHVTGADLTNPQVLALATAGSLTAAHTIGTSTTLSLNFPSVAGTASATNGTELVFFFGYTTFTVITESVSDHTITAGAGEFDSDGRRSITWSPGLPNDVASDIPAILWFPDTTANGAVTVALKAVSELTAGATTGELELVTPARIESGWTFKATASSFGTGEAVTADSSGEATVTLSRGLPGSIGAGAAAVIRRPTLYPEPYTGTTKRLRLPMRWTGAAYEAPVLTSTPTISAAVGQEIRMVLGVTFWTMTPFNPNTRLRWRPFAGAVGPTVNFNMQTSAAPTGSDRPVPVSTELQYIAHAAGSAGLYHYIDLTVKPTDVSTSWFAVDLDYYGTMLGDSAAEWRNAVDVNVAWLELLAELRRGARLPRSIRLTVADLSKMTGYDVAAEEIVLGRYVVIETSGGLRARIVGATIDFLNPQRTLLTLDTLPTRASVLLG